MTDTTTNFFRIKRRAAGLSQQRLADKLGVSKQLVSLWETGRCIPNAEWIPGLAESLGMKPETLVRRFEDSRRRQPATASA